MFLTAVNTTLILSLLRDQFTQNGTDIAAYIIPYSGSHYSGSVAPCEQRIAAISGFTGSSGSVIVTNNPPLALLWTDGRYFLQAESELDENWTLMRAGEAGVATESEWLLLNLVAGSRVGVDGFVYPKSAWDGMLGELGSGDIELVHFTNVESNQNLVDVAWGVDRPPCTANPIEQLPIEFAGKSVDEKLGEVRGKMAAEGVDLLLVSELEEVAWLFNLRGTDLPPTFFSFALILADAAELVIKQGTMTAQIEALLLEDGNVTVLEDYEIIDTILKDRVASASVTRVWMSKYVNAEMVQLATEKEVLIQLSPIALLKAIKNPIEVEGMRNAHLRDSAAIVAFLSWLERRVVQEPINPVTEISAAEKLYEIRASSIDQNFVDQSFSTISAFGSNAAIIHYSPTTDTDRRITVNGLYLVDSGGQYRDGTTDITRTLHFGSPNEEHKDRFTRVLKGHIALATAVFPNKVTGNRLDPFARKFLWDVKLDYNHGSGHGIGHYLMVHEGPQSISSQASADDSGLEANMFVSNEPGFYKEGEEGYGIRLENILRVMNNSDDGFLEMETVSFVPIQLKLIDGELLTPEEIAWLDEYHAQCRDKVGDFINAVTYFEDRQEALDWLQAATVTWNEFSSASQIFISTFNMVTLFLFQNVLITFLV